MQSWRQPVFLFSIFLHSIKYKTCLHLFAYFWPGVQFYLSVHENRKKTNTFCHSKTVPFPYCSWDCYMCSCHINFHFSYVPSHSSDVQPMRCSTLMWHKWSASLGEGHLEGGPLEDTSSLPAMQCAEPVLHEMKRVDNCCATKLLPPNNIRHIGIFIYKKKQALFLLFSHFLSPQYINHSENGY